MTAKVRTHSSVFGRFQFAQIPASANGSPDFIPMADGCFALAPLIARHSKKLSIGSKHPVGEEVPPEPAGIRGCSSRQRHFTELSIDPDTPPAPTFFWVMRPDIDQMWSGRGYPAT